MENAKYSDIALRKIVRLINLSNKFLIQNNIILFKKKSTLILPSSSNTIREIQFKDYNRIKIIFLENKDCNNFNFRFHLFRTGHRHYTV